ncbi:hypothetical protein M116_3109 [Bacteroides fragilis str. 3719 A10]|nr:hypothetical protein M116_3109 [Bacteroides fragilis str. 3719 A10]
MNVPAAGYIPRNIDFISLITFTIAVTGGRKEILVYGEAE